MLLYYLNNFFLPERLMKEAEIYGVMRYDQRWRRAAKAGQR